MSFYSVVSTCCSLPSIRSPSLNYPGFPGNAAPLLLGCKSSCSGGSSALGMWAVWICPIRTCGSATFVPSQWKTDFATASGGENLGPFRCTWCPRVSRLSLLSGLASMKGEAEGEGQERGEMSKTELWTHEQQWLKSRLGRQTARCGLFCRLLMRSFWTMCLWASVFSPVKWESWHSYSWSCVRIRRVHGNAQNSAQRWVCTCQRQSSSELCQAVPKLRPTPGFFQA